MKNFVYAIFMMILLSSCCSSRMNFDETKAIEVSTILNTISKRVKKISKQQHQAGDLDVKIKLQNVIAKEVETNVSFFVVQGDYGRKWEYDNSFTAKYQFKIPEPKSSLVTADLEDIAQALEDAFVRYEAVATSDEIGRKGFELVLIFSVSDEGGAGISIDIEPLSFGASGKRTRKTVHEITFSYMPYPVKDTINGAVQ